MSPDSGPEAKIDTTALGAWMDKEGLPGAGQPIEQRYVSGGSQNEIFEIRRGELHGALRKPPATDAYTSCVPRCKPTRRSRTARIIASRA